jgi:hypothetical protein
MPPDPDPLAAELAGIRDRAAQITGDHDPADCIGDLGGPCSGHDAERLADVAEAVLALHQRSRFVLLGALCKGHAVCRDFSITSNEADHVGDCPDCSATVSVSCTCGYPDLERCPHRLAIARELLGKGNSRA